MMMIQSQPLLQELQNMSDTLSPRRYCSVTAVRAVDESGAPNPSHTMTLACTG